MIIKHYIFLFLFSAVICHWQIAFSQNQETIKECNANTSNDLIEQILDDIENRYSAPGFSATFFQESTLKAMDITDTASGLVNVKRPGMMRWEYKSPDPQIIITDGNKLWIYRPEDNQVMIGKAPSFFKDGKGAGFLSDMKLLRDKFSIFLDTSEMSSNGDYYLKLYPEDRSLDLATIFLVVDPKTYIIKNIITYNIYDDETRIQMSDYNFDVDFKDSAFIFTIPENTDILEMD